MYEACWPQKKTHVSHTIIVDSAKFNDTRETSSGDQNVYLFNIAKDPTEHFEVCDKCWFTYKGMLLLELSFVVLETPNDAYTTLSQSLIGCLTLSQVYCDNKK